MGRVIYLNGHVYSPVDPFATAIVVEGSQVAWIGQDGAARANASVDDEVIDLQGALVAPGFVDAHVHHSAAGLALTGLDLSAVRSVEELLHRLRDACAQASPSDVVLGQGWDESTWSDSRLPSRHEIDLASQGRAVYMSRVDAHSAFISSAMETLAPSIAQVDGYSTNTVVGQAHHVARETAMASLSDEQRRSAIRAFRRHAASLGIVAMHECSGPIIAGAHDLAIVAEVAREIGPEAVLYWGEDRNSTGTAIRGLGGDFFVDGSFGSRTALLSANYEDQDTRGMQYLHMPQMTDHVIECTRLGLQAGFHAIGDEGIAMVIQSFKQAAEVLGISAVRGARHRIEHVEFISTADIAVMAELGIVASVQPGFDATWGGPHGMYAQRLGQRHHQLNPFAAMSSAGVILAFGSDAPVLPVSPWENVRAAAFTHNVEHRISVRAAFAAHTRGGHRAAGDDIAGVLAPGAPAHLAVWAPTELVVQAPDDRISAWSTDPRSGTPGLPDVSPDQPLPTCLRTVRNGAVIFDSGWLAS